MTQPDVPRPWDHGCCGDGHCGMLAFCLAARDVEAALHGELFYERSPDGAATWLPRDQLVAAHDQRMAPHLASPITGHLAEARRQATTPPAPDGPVWPPRAGTLTVGPDGTVTVPHAGRWEIRSGADVAAVQRYLGLAVRVTGL